MPAPHTSMSQPFVLLIQDAGARTSSRRVRGAPLAGAASGPVVPKARIEVDAISTGRANALVRERKVAAAAPVMPMALVAPVAVAAADSTAAPSWALRAIGADTSPFDGSGVTVAVLDTGIDASHPAFAGMQIEQRNFSDDADGADLHGHGTHCAGTIFGRDVDGRRIGVARGVCRALIGKVLGAGGGGSDRIAQAIQWALDGGATVVSMSLGFDFPGYARILVDQGRPVELATSMALEAYRANVLLFERLAGFVAARGQLSTPALLVAAAGNESRRDLDADYAIAVSPPAVADGIISVAALAPSLAGHVVAPFSNTGARIAAPGVGIVSARAGGGLVSMDGTSMAAPHVAGVAALWAQNLALRGALRASSWSDRVIGSGTTTDLARGFLPDDVGVGIVRAPQA